LPITIYGIKNCDTMKKARAWLDNYGVVYGFHDYKTQGIARERLDLWEKKVGWEAGRWRISDAWRYAFAIVVSQALP
jgi:arsenate reductase-like glutaredoxin family protein